MPTIDTRPTKLDIAARTGDARTLRLTFPADYLDDHASWAANFGGETVTPVIAGDVMTITVTAGITAELGNGRHLWTLTDTVVNQTRIAGRLLLGDDATESSDTTVDVTIADIVDVTIEILAGGGGANLAYTASATQGVVTSDSGTDATIPAATGTNAGLILPAEKTKLAGVATGATANSTDATLLARANHTGTQAISTVTGLQAALDAEATARGAADTAEQTRALAAEALLAPKASPVFTGDPTVPAGNPAGINSIPRKKYVDDSIAALSGTTQPLSARLTTLAGRTDATEAAALRTAALDAAYLGIGAKAADADLLDGANLSTDGTLAGNSDVLVPTQKAVKTYADQLIASADAMVFKGVIDASANPNYPAADRGHTYRISVAGKIGGAAGPNVEAGDLILALTDGTAAGNHATVGASWSIAQANIDGGVIGPAAATDGAVALFDGTTGKFIKNSTAAAAKTSLALVKGDVGLGNVDNTSDANKPVSTAQQTALDAKLALGQSAYLPAWKSGYHYFVPNFLATTTTGSSGVGTLRTVPFWVPSDITIDRIGAEVTSAGDAGSKVRLGIYADDGAGEPGALVLDAGQIPGDSVAVHLLTVSQALPKGIYHAAWAVQSVVTTQPGLRVQSGAGMVLSHGGPTVPGAAAVRIGHTLGGVTGAFPNPLTGFGYGVNNIPRLLLRVA